MHLGAKDIIGRSVKASDGDIGKIKDIYFEDEDWSIRYLVVKLGGLLSHKEVLLIPSCFVIPEARDNSIETHLSTREVENSPPADSHMPVSRQYEVLLHNYYGWEPYWYYPYLAGFGAIAHAAFPGTSPVVDPETLVRVQNEIKAKSDPHLRSFNDLKGYHLKTVDGEFGHVVDVLIDQKTARLSHVVVDTVNWWPSQNVVLDTSAVKEIAWEDKCIVLSLTKDEIKNAPPIDGSRAIIDNRYGKSEARGSTFGGEP